MCFYAFKNFVRLLFEFSFSLTLPLSIFAFAERRRRRGQRRRGEIGQVQTAAPPGAPLHPAAQAGHLHRPARVLRHHALPEPPALARPAGGQPPHHAPLHAPAHPQPRAGGLQPLLLHLPVLRRGCCGRQQPGPAPARHAQIRHPQPAALQ